MAKYTVSFRTVGYYYVEVDANSSNDAADIAQGYWENANFGELEDLDASISYIEDEAEGLRIDFE